MKKSIVTKELHLQVGDLIDSPIDINEHISPIGFKDFLSITISKLNSTLGSMSARRADEVVQQCAQDIKRFFNL